MIPKQLFFFAFLFSLSHVACLSSNAQTKKDLTLQQCLDYAHKNGPNAKIARNVFRSKTYNYRSFNAGLLPQVLLTGTLPDYSRAIIAVTQSDGTTRYVPQSQANSMATL